MNQTLLALGPTLSVDIPAIHALVAVLAPAQIITHDDQLQGQSPAWLPEMTHAVLCAASGSGTQVHGWAKKIRSRMTHIQAMAFVEIADEDSPDSWLLDEQGWLDLPQSPSLATRIAAGDAASGLDFALALVTCGYPASHPLPETDASAFITEFHRKTPGE